MTDSPHTDDVTGVDTTGHQWDDIHELNKPAAEMVGLQLLRPHRLVRPLLDRHARLAHFHERRLDLYGRRHRL